MGQKPDCVLCPNKGGAMKSTRSGQKWAHVSCALWIPEVSIGSVDRMEPITKISSIPQSRWALVCVLCRERVGACIQCSVKTCKTAYHVTCAFQHGLEMRAIIEDENAEDGVKLRSYCQKHSVKKEPKNSANAEKKSASGSASEDEEKTNKKKLRKEMTSEERNHARLARLVEIQSEFDKHVSVKDISCHLLDVDQEGINHIYNYWILKRKANGNEPLLLPKSGDVDVMSQTDQEQADVEKMKMFVHLRQDLERVRNLCYMVSRREKLSRSFFKMREQIFHKQYSILSNHHRKTTKLDDESLRAILDANHGPSIYDVLYSSDSIKDSRVMMIDEMIDLILGNNASSNKASTKSLLEINGNINKKDKMDAVTRYSKLFNGGNTSSNRKFNYDSITSDTDDSAIKQSTRKSHITTSSSEEDHDMHRSPTRSRNVKDISSSTNQSISTSSLNNNALTPSNSTNQQQQQPKKKGRPPGSTKQAAAEKRRLLNSINLKDSSSKSKSAAPLNMSIDSSSEDELPHPKVKSPLATRTRLKSIDDNQHLTDESDELVPIRNSSGHSIPTQGGTIKKMHSSAIYSDSDSSSTDKDNRTDHTVSDSQQQPFRTKAAMKEFNVNELIAFNKLKKITEVQETPKKNAMSIKKASSNSSITSPTLSQQSKKPDLPPPQTIKKEVKSSPAKATKSRRMSTKLQNSLSSDSESEDVSKKPTTQQSTVKETVKEKEKDKKSNQQPKKDILTDFLVVPQREAAKKASENLMKTTTVTNQSATTATTPNDKHRRDTKEKVDEPQVSSSKSSESEKEKQKDTKDGKSSKSSKSSKDKTVKNDKKEEQKKLSEKTNEKETKTKEKEPEKEEKTVSDFSTDFLPYVPQRQAAKKAAEHIKGLGNSSSLLQQQVSVEEKPKPPTTTSATRKSMPEKQKSKTVDLSSSSSADGSSSSDDSDSESDNVSQKQSTKVTPKVTPKVLPTRRASVAATASLKQKTKDSPFLDKAARSSVHVETSSSSSYESDDSSSDRPNTSRLSEKGNKNKRRSTEQPAATVTKKGATPAVSPKKSSTAKKEAESKSPTRRMSTITKPSQPAPTVTSPASKTSTKSSQKVPETPKPPESITTSQSRKRSTSIASPPPKVPSNSKSRNAESSKRDMAKLSDKEKSTADIKKSAEQSPATTPTITPKTDVELGKRRRSSVLSPVKSIEPAKPTKDQKNEEIEKQKSQSKASVESSKVPTPVEKEKEVEPEAPKSKEKPVVIEKKPDEKKEEVKEKEKPAEKKQDDKLKSNTSNVIEINDESENDDQRKRARTDNKEKEKPKGPAVDVDDSEVRMDIDETISEPKPIITPSKEPLIPETKLSNSPKVNIPMSSPMVSIPTENLNRMQEKSDENKLINESFKSLPIAVARQESSTSNALFDSIKTNIEDTEKETYNLIEKLRQKNKKTSNATIVPDNNNVTSEKPNELLKPCMMQNENTPKRDNFEQPINQQIPLRAPNASPLTECNELKKLSPWHQQQQQQQGTHPMNDNTNYQRNILTSSCNKINSPMEPTPPSCMVIEQQQKQLAACQKMSEENMMVNNRSIFMPSMQQIMMNDPTSNNHMDVFMDPMQQQQAQHQKWHKDSKSINLKMMQQQQHERIQDNLIKRTDSGMENMMNNMNQPAIKNFAAMQKSPNNFPGMQPHIGPQPQQQQPQEPFNAYNFQDHTNQYTGAVSLFPTDTSVQVPFPSPGQAMFAPNFTNTFTSTQQQIQSNDHSMMMQSSSAHIKINSNEMSMNMHYSNQNVCAPPAMFNPQQQPSPQILPNELQMMSNMQSSNSIECGNILPASLDKQTQDTVKKSPSKSTRSSPRNTTPSYSGGKTPQKSPSKSPRQPSTPASVESLSRQNSQKGKMTPTTNEGKQRKSRSNSQASPASTPSDRSTANANKGRGRANKNNKRFPTNAMPFMPFNNEAGYLAIDKKLVGTVYDFSADEDFPPTPNVENLTAMRAMRDRRKSVDLYNKTNKDGSSQSPKFMMKSSLKPSTPLSHPLAINNHTMPNTVVNESEQLPVASSITSINLVNMPGPVDMRTYNSFDNTNDSYSSQLLGAFATNTVDQTLNEIDEEQEKELQTALKAANDKQKTPTSNAATNNSLQTSVEIVKSTTEITTIIEESVDSSEASFAKVSLSDSRNQLKLKIKGPLAHHHDMQSQSVTHAQAVPQAISSGASSNRRQMRKKELLQQYWNQGMNMDQEPSNIAPIDQQAPSNISSNRVGGIPKAVDSMGLSLLKDEFQDFNYAEYKKRKRFALRGVDPLDVTGSSSMDVTNETIEVDPLAIDTSTNNKKRNRRPNRAGQQLNTAANPPPKLKIKIGSDIVETTGSDLPPKKRLIAQPPSYQDLKRESMNFRKQMMEEFSEQSKEQRMKQEKRERKEKKKRKKEKKRSVEIVSQSVPEGPGPVKLILKISNKTAPPADGTKQTPPPPTPVNDQAAKSTPPPIKLKLSRNSQGNGEYNILNASAGKKKDPNNHNSQESATSVSSANNNNNNLQPPIIDASDINAITTKKLEVSLERIEDIEKAKSDFTNKQIKESSKDDAGSNNCEVR